MFKLFCLSVPLLAGSALAAPSRVEHSPARVLEARQSTVTPQCWNGTNFPATSAWVDYDTLFNNNAQSMLANNDTQEEVGTIKASIAKYASQGGYPPQLALAIMMRESGGITTTPCGDAGKSCGLMQVQGPQGLQCSAHPCPNIDYQIQCGTVGACPGQTGSDIASCLSRYGDLPGAAARCYNTGSVPDPSDYTVATYGIRSYVQDIANILLGAEGFEIWGLDQQCGLS